MVDPAAEPEAFCCFTGVTTAGLISAGFGGGTTVGVGVDVRITVVAGVAAATGAVALNPSNLRTDPFFNAGGFRNKAKKKVGWEKAKRSKRKPVHSVIGSAKKNNPNML